MPISQSSFNFTNVLISSQNIYFILSFIGGSRGAHLARAPCKGPDSFALTYKFYETYPSRELASPYEVGAPNNGKSWIRHCLYSCFIIITYICLSFRMYEHLPTLQSPNRRGIILFDYPGYDVIGDVILFNEDVAPL